MRYQRPPSFPCFHGTHRFLRGLYFAAMAPHPEFRLRDWLNNTLADDVGTEPPWVLTENGWAQDLDGSTWGHFNQIALPSTRVWAGHPISMTAFLYLDAAPSVSTTLMSGLGWTPSCFVFDTDSSNYLRCRRRTSSGYPTRTANGVIGTGLQHWAGTYAGGLRAPRLYINGQKQDGTWNNGTGTDAEPDDGLVAAPRSYINGRLFLFTVHDRVLSDAEIAESAREPFAPFYPAPFRPTLYTPVAGREETVWMPGI